MTGFSERLKQERKRVRLSQAEAAEVGGVSMNSQSNYENGHRSPDAEYLSRLAARGVDVLYLVTGVRSTVQHPGVPMESSVIDEHLEPRGCGWQTVIGPITVWSPSNVRRNELFVAAMREAADFQFNWVDSKDIAVDFCVLPEATTGGEISLADRFNSYANLNLATAHSIRLGEFTNLLNRFQQSILSPREILWRHFFGRQSPYESGAIFLVGHQAGGRTTPKLIRVSRIVKGSPGTFLLGHWEATGNIAEISVDQIDDDLTHIGSGRLLTRADVVSGFSGNGGESITREVTHEQAALLDNYENADEEGRDAARRVLVALSKSKASKKAA